jgi:hypothetical protein
MRSEPTADLKLRKAARDNPVRVIEAFIDEPTPFAGTRRDLWYPYRSKRCDFGLETGRDLAKIRLLIGRPYNFEKTR